MKFNLALAVAIAIAAVATAANANDRADRERAWETVFRAALAQGRTPIVRCTLPPVICADTLLWQAIDSPEVMLIVGPFSSRVICVSAAGLRRCMNVATGDQWLEIWSGAAWTVTGAN
jgi:hypothetical protein